MSASDDRYRPAFIRFAFAEDREWIRNLLRDTWFSTRIVTRGVLHEADQLPALVAETRSSERVGLLTFTIVEKQLEIVILNSTRKRAGIGKRLVRAGEDLARRRNCSRVWVITTNDNSDAISFYETLGYNIVSVHKGAIEVSRKLKPEIPLTGVDGVPITDEIELEKILT
ncbi:MAG: GNAT family N-acetyltransferase [Candidatus Thorarchaeota archaeon]